MNHSYHHDHNDNDQNADHDHYERSCHAGDGAEYRQDVNETVDGKKQ